jgi:hypothetical protein
MHWSKCDQNLYLLWSTQQVRNSSFSWNGTYQIHKHKSSHSHWSTCCLVSLTNSSPSPVLTPNSTSCFCGSVVCTLFIFVHIVSFVWIHHWHGAGHYCVIVCCVLRSCMVIAWLHYCIVFVVCCIVFYCVAYLCCVLVLRTCVVYLCCVLVCVWVWCGVCGVCGVWCGVCGVVCGGSGCVVCVVWCVCVVCACVCGMCVCACVCARASNQIWWISQWNRLRKNQQLSMNQVMNWAFFKFENFYKFY